MKKAEESAAPADRGRIAALVRHGADVVSVALALVIVGWGAIRRKPARA